MTSCTDSASPVSRSAQDPCWEQHHGFNQFKDSLDGDPDQPEGQEQQPDERVEHQRQQSQRPAQNQQKTPKQELDHHSRESSRRAPDLSRAESLGATAMAARSLCRDCGEAFDLQRFRQCPNCSSLAAQGKVRARHRRLGLCLLVVIALIACSCRLLVRQPGE